MLADSSSRFSHILWASNKPKRVCRGTGAGELVAFADGINASIGVHTLLQETLSRRIPMSAYTDATSFHDICSGFREAADLQGQPDVYFVRQMLLRGHLNELNRIDGTDNPADATTNDTKSLHGNIRPNRILQGALLSGRLEVSLFARIQRRTSHAKYLGTISTSKPQLALGRSNREPSLLVGLRCRSRYV